MPCWRRPSPTPEPGASPNATLADYLVPVNADIPDMDVIFVGEPDRFNPIGVKGVGEIGLVGIAAAIANAEPLSAIIIAVVFDPGGHRS